MSDYTHKRLPDVDDMAPQFGMPAEMQARFAARPLGLERTGLTYFRLAPGFRIPFAHRHEDQEEVYVVIRGSARIKIGDDVLDLSELDAVRVPGDTLRNLEAGPDGAEVIAFGERAGEEQSEMVQGWWSEDSRS
jgi:mannose-6-phosphate isomerase-like protein (cupin superfamily)